MVIRTSEFSCELIMSGGEFCGNACRAAAKFMQSNFGIENSIININGMRVKAFCNDKKSVVSIDKNELIKEIRMLEKDVWLVKQQDMTQVVIQPKSQYFKQNPTKDYAVYLKEKFNLDDVAVGIIFFNGKSQIPFIWVRDVDTFYEETACVSGSISSALTLPEKIVKVKQPSGATYAIIENKESISVFGDCYKERQKSILLSNKIDKNQKQYKKLEKSFLRYTDLLMLIGEVNDEANKEKLIEVPSNLTVSTDPLFVRESVLKKLQLANNRLSKKNKNCQLIVLEGYRSLSAQRDQFDVIFEQTKIKQKDVCEVEIYEECHKQIAVPEVAGHPTGGAVDVCILNKQNNQLLDFGTQWKDFNSSKKNYTLSPEVSKTAIKNRKLLKKTMEQQGFYQYPAEWWHFSYGDVEWAVANNKDCALYKQVEFIK